MDRPEELEQVWQCMRELEGRTIYSKLAEGRFPAYQEVPQLAL